jgi:hypothetical protein
MPKQGLGVGKGRWLEIRNSGLCSARDENKLWLRLQNGGKEQFLSFPHFLF